MRGAVRYCRSVTFLLPVLAIVLASCAQPIAGSATPAGSAGTGERSDSPGGPSGSSRPSSTPIALETLEGTWQGTYTCNQGETGMRLIIKAPQGGSVPAIFEFFPLEGKDNSESGSYAIRGSVVDGHLEFRGQRWIDKPEGYVMVGLVVTSAGSTELAGKVDGNNCTTFTVTRSRG